MALQMGPYLNDWKMSNPESAWGLILVKLSLLGIGRGGQALGLFTAGVFIVALVNQGGGPFGEALAEEATGVLGFGFAGGFHADGAVVEGEVAGGVIGDAEDEESEIDQQGEEGLAGEFHAAAPGAGGGEGAGDFTVDFHPVREHGFVPESFHFPGDEAHVGGAAEGESVAPGDILGGGGFVDGAEADFGVGDALGAFGDQLGHGGGVTGGGVEEDKDAVHRWWVHETAWEGSRGSARRGE